MTVSSLWKVLDKAGCGKTVGSLDLITMNASQSAGQQVKTCYGGTPSFDPSNRTSLAVDLSIWICESLTSYGMMENNVNPALHLVFSRTMKLLTMGVKLVFVVEGKRRIRGEGSRADKFHKRRSGTAFWKACRDCEQMLKLLGVPVVRAKAEGEALCALLNQRGIVDGVISNDGDCLLFGAKIVLTKFSLENLANCQVVRYDLNDLRAFVDQADDKDVAVEEIGVLKLSRHDLVAYALLTGSDLAGSGFDKVGYKKAVRFIRKCQLDFPLTIETAAIDEVKSWARATSAIPNEANEVQEHKEKGSRCCSRCSHPGSKRHHEKHGCDLCGTAPGEPCFKETTEDRFRKYLRAKALAMVPKFDPEQVIDAYMNPNDNQIPIQFVHTTSKNLRMAHPSMNALLRKTMIIKGQSLEASRAFVKEAVGRLMARNELFLCSEQNGPSGEACRLSRERPVPQRISRLLIKNQIPCYEVSWLAKGTATDDNGEDINGYEYSTVEPRDLFDKRYPKLKDAYKEPEKEYKKQGDGEQVRRMAFLEKILGVWGSSDDDRKPCFNTKDERRKLFFQKRHISPVKLAAHDPKRRKMSGNSGSDDVFKLLLQGNHRHGQKSEKGRTDRYMTPTKAVLPRKKSFDTYFETPDSRLYCHMGKVMVEVTPIMTNHGSFPPQNIFMLHKSTPSTVSTIQDSCAGLLF